MTATGESELAERAAAGDVAAFAELVRTHQAKAFGYALTILGDFPLAQDATQEAFVAAYLGLQGLRDRAKFAPWLREIVRHQCGHFLRRLSETTASERVLETGLKAFDLLCPLAQGGAVGIFGGAGVGKAVLSGELLHNLGAATWPTLFAFVEPGEEVTFMHRLLPKVPIADPMRQALFVAIEQARALDSPELAGVFDLIIYLAREIVGLHVFPAVDALHSSPRLLTPTVVGDERYRVAGEVRDLFALPGDGPSAGREDASAGRRIGRGTRRSGSGAAAAALPRATDDHGNRLHEVAGAGGAAGGDDPGLRRDPARGLRWVTVGSVLDGRDAG